MAVMTGWEAVVKALKAEGIKFVYGLPSSPADLYDALYDEPEIEAVMVPRSGRGHGHGGSFGNGRPVFALP